MALDSSIDTSLEQTLPGIDEGEIIVIRSKKRKRNIAAFRQGGKIIISIPARLSKAEEREVVPEMIAKIRAKEVAPAESERGMAGDERALGFLHLCRPHYPLGDQVTASAEVRPGFCSVSRGDPSAACRPWPRVL